MTAFERSKNRNRTGQLYELGHHRRDGQDTVFMGGKTASAAWVVKAGDSALPNGLPGIRFFAIELEIGRHHAVETPQPRQPFFAARFSFNLKGSSPGNPNLDIVSSFS